MIGCTQRKCSASITFCAANTVEAMSYIGLAERTAPKADAERTGVIQTETVPPAVSGNMATLAA